MFSQQGSGCFVRLPLLLNQTCKAGDLILQVGFMKCESFMHERLQLTSQATFCGGVTETRTTVEFYASKANIFILKMFQKLFHYNF